MTVDGDLRRLLDAVPAGPMDPHARLVRQVLRSDAALVTVIDGEAQRFLGMTGLDGSARRRRGTPLDRSLCHTVQATEQPLAIEDLAGDPAFRDHGALHHLDVHAYLGVPLRTPDGDVVGAVCALQHDARNWTEEDLEQVATMRDVVEAGLRPTLQAHRDRSRAREVALLLSTLRHELGGDLQIVLGGIETARLPDLDPVLRDRVLVNAHRNCQSVIATLDALLRMDSRAPVLHRRADLRTLVLEAMESPDVMRHTGRIELDVPSIEFVTEPLLLGHVVRNILGNACKYSDGTVRVTGRREDEQAVSLTVDDEGPGIPRAVLAQLFEPFSRPRDDAGESGFGLGLHIVRALCRRLDAELRVASDDEGTSVTVVAPDGQSPKPSNAASSSDWA